MFSDHLSGRDFEFSACGFFRLNMSLITSVRISVLFFMSGWLYLIIFFLRPPPGIIKLKVSGFYPGSGRTWQVKVIEFIQGLLCKI